jgi:hypothetical protein
VGNLVDGNDALERAFIALCDPDVPHSDPDEPRDRLIRYVANLIQNEDDDHARIYTADCTLIEPHTDQGPYARRTLTPLHAAVVDLVLTIDDAEADLCSAGCGTDDPTVISMRTMARIRIALSRVEQARRELERDALGRPAYH